MTGAFDGARHATLKQRGHSGNPSRQDLPAFGDELTQEAFVPVVDFMQFQFGEAAAASPASSATEPSPASGAAV
jgi:hypothetical protein